MAQRHGCWHGFWALQTVFESLPRAHNVVVCVEDIKLRTLARACIVPGLPNLLFFLSSSEGTGQVRTLMCSASLPAARTFAAHKLQVCCDWEE